MSRNFHTVHVRSDDPAELARAITRWLEGEGFERVGPRARADRVVRISAPKHGWVTIVDEGYQASEIARVATERSARIAVEAYCEASAIVWLALVRGGEPAGGWGIDEAPAPGVIDEIGIEGLERGALSARWDDAVREIFPETALAVAAQMLRIDVARMFDEAELRGGIAVRARRAKDTWTPREVEGPVALELTAYPGDVLFVDREVELRVGVESRGGAGRGIEVRFEDEQDLFELRALTIDGVGTFAIESNVARVPDLRIAAGLVETPDTGSMTRREADRAWAEIAKRRFTMTIAAHTEREGEGVLRCAIGDASCSLGTRVSWQPHRPRRTLDVARDRDLYAMHLMTRRFGTVSFAGSLADAWAWARPHVERWCDRVQGSWWATIGTRIVAHDREGAIAAIAGGPAEWATLHAPGVMFGCFGSEPGRVFDGQEPVVVLTLHEPIDGEDDASSLRGILDDAMRSGVGLGALMASWENAPTHNDATIWEKVAVGHSDALRYRSWHVERVRGLDHDGVWLGATHLARVRLAALPDFVEVERLGPAVRLTVPRARRRAELRAIEDVLDAVMPSRDAAEAWEAAHPGRWR
ncbi:hypothetical protein [Sandaracinus amylolyticus]|uniref:hypothetical protein n=1 Tax=Sandaracinus amylolyticus TaxID=927083 RepID=UPI001F1C2CC2|nr:hypothetical protein [Sandaracinus amylolyticus]UJR86818.1 Hypothetical protein I5071_89190 [Sandaracinus amylolyticus]